MHYVYKEIRPKIFTDEGQRLFLEIRDRTNDLLRIAGAARMREILYSVSTSLSLWDGIACVDRMVELNEIREITGDKTMGQHRVFVNNKE